MPNARQTNHYYSNAVQCCSMIPSGIQTVSRATNQAHMRGGHPSNRHIQTVAGDIQGMNLDPMHLACTSVIVGSLFLVDVYIDHFNRISD
jgi:hypothetical protein